MDAIALLLAATLSSGTLLAFAALGLLINERAGIVNLGAEGMMLVAALAGFATAVHTGSDWLAFAAGAAAGAVLAAAFGALVIWLNTNQYATGLALSLFGVGFSAFAGIGFVQEKLPQRPRFSIPLLGDTTAGLTQSGRITFDPPADWKTASIGGSSTCTGGAASRCRSSVGRWVGSSVVVSHG